MYQYTDFDKQFVKLRAQQFRDQLERWQKGELTDEQMLPLRLQNGWYIQRYAPMARIAVPYGEISSLQLRTLGISRANTTAPALSCWPAPRPRKTPWRPASPAPPWPHQRCNTAMATSPRAPTASSTGFPSPARPT